MSTRMNPRLTARLTQLVFFASVVLSPGGLALAASTENIPDGASVSFRWAARAVDVAGLQQHLGKNGATLESNVERFRPPADEVEDYTEASFAPLMVVAGAVAVAILAQAILDFYRGAKHGGVIVDARGSNLDIREHPALQPGTIVVISREAQLTRFEPKASIDLGSLLKAMGSGK